MQNTRLVFAAAALIVSGSAWSQSTATLFGVIDLNARFVKNGSAGSNKTLSQDGIASNRLGLRGTESLGGGLRAGYWLEGFLSPDTGAGPQSWTRRSTVSLLGDFGELRLGRDYTPDFWNHSIFDPFGTNGVGSSINIIAALNGANTFLRADNSIGYLLPPLGGLYGQAMVAAGEGAAGNKHAGLRIGYSEGPWNVAVAYGKTQVDTVRDFVRWNVGASYNLGFMTIMAQYTDTEANGGAGDGQGRDNMLIGAIVPFDAHSIKFSLSKTAGSGVFRNRDATQTAIGYQYDLSQRTAVYANYARIANKGGAVSTVTLSGPSGMRPNEKSTGYEFGLRHLF